MVNSMTGFAALKGASGNTRWHWEVRSVNARGLDIRMRLPEGCEALEPVVRGAFTKKLTRGNVNLTLKLQKEIGAAPVTLDEAQLARVVGAMKTVEEAADAQGMALAPSCAADILALRGVLDANGGDDGELDEVIEALKNEVPTLVADFVAARGAEGKATEAILTGQIATVDDLVTKASEVAEGRKDQVAVTLRENMAKVMENIEGVDEGRLAQELALLAVKADVTEEIDRLGAHITAARDLLAFGGAIGRKFDFLMQEFNREANTLCSKSGSTALTGIGLDLKTVIDQMREQVQNVE